MLSVFLLPGSTGICAQVGETDRAFELLETESRQPVGITYGSLKLDEIWDPLRNDPRFDKLVAALALK